MQDSFGRTINYLRLSLTEACNFRCAYCAPSGYTGPSFPALTLEEIQRIVRVAMRLGLDRIRLTGGEPLLRRDILEIVSAIREIDGLRDLSLTTNAFLLAPLARSLAERGLRRVNISLDTLRPERFAGIVGRDAFPQVWAGIQAAEAAGLTPLKINVVGLRGINDDEFGDFADWTREHEWHIRLIELMPVGDNQTARAYFERHFVSAAEMSEKLPGLEPVNSPEGNGPAKTYRLPGARGTVGFITPASQHFCSGCNRVRVTGAGVLRPCLFGEREIDLRPALERGDDEALEDLFVRAVAHKPDEHPCGEAFVIKRGMSQIGG